MWFIELVMSTRVKLSLYMYVLIGAVQVITVFWKISWQYSLSAKIVLVLIDPGLLFLVCSF